MTQATKLDLTNGIDRGIGELLKRALVEDLFGAVLAPIRSPNGTAFALVTNPELLDELVVMPTAMPIHGAKAVQSITQRELGKKTAVVMRMCEIRATIELSKLEQANVEDLTFVSFDCPGVTPLPSIVERSADEGDQLPPRPLCQICEHFGPMDGEGAKNVDLHIATLGLAEDGALLVPITAKGEAVLEKLDLDTVAPDDVEAWTGASAELRADRIEKRERVLTELLEHVHGDGGLTAVYERCVECHNCQSVCPICYCRLCFADKGTTADSPTGYLQRAEATGVVRPASDPLLFHLGRMAHMSLSCVSCGLCEDACPVDIPVGRVISAVSRETRRLFGYVAGRSPDETLPLIRFEQDELTELEDG